MWGVYSGKWLDTFLAAGFIFVYLLAITIIILIVTQKIAVGAGDIWLSTALGAWFGSQGIIGIILLASILGLIFSLVKSLFIKSTGSIISNFKKSFTITEVNQVGIAAQVNIIPFGTFLIIAAWFVWIMNLAKGGF